jgi:hypothetical protein
MLASAFEVLLQAVLLQAVLLHPALHHHYPWQVSEMYSKYKAAADQANKERVEKERVNGQGMQLLSKYQEKKEAVGKVSWQAWQAVCRRQRGSAAVAQAAALWEGTCAAALCARGCTQVAWQQPAPGASTAP